jgi:hypothetical protein
VVVSPELAEFAPETEVVDPSVASADCEIGSTFVAQPHPMSASAKVVLWWMAGFGQRRRMAKM